MIRVLVVGQVRLMCHVFRAVFQDEADIEVAGCATSADETLLKAGQSDVVLVSASSPNDGELELIRRVVMNPAVKILVMGLPTDKQIVVQYLEAGAAGYVLEDDSLDRLLANIRAVYREESHVSPEIAAALISRLAELHVRCDRGGDGWASGIDLSPREREVLELVRQGLSNREIADRLTIELGTVKNHIHTVLKKLNVKTRHDAAQLVA
jgi:two-component system, NarL family, nitrate/nitrite response regulator NarL